MKSAAPITVTDGFSFQDANKKVILYYQGKEHTLYLSKGIRYLLILLRHPNQNIACEELESYQNPPQNAYSQLAASLKYDNQPLQIQKNFPSLPMADLQTIDEVKAELLKVIDELAELEENCDYARADAVREKYEQLCAYLEEVYDPKGRILYFLSEEKRTKKRVVRAIQRALEEIEKVEPKVAKDLRNALCLGATLCYNPDR